jgi:hypothetical protein
LPKVELSITQREALLQIYFWESTLLFLECLRIRLWWANQSDSLKRKIKIKLNFGIKFFLFSTLWYNWGVNQSCQSSQIWLLKKYERKNPFSRLPIWTMYRKLVRFLKHFEFLSKTLWICHKSFQIVFQQCCLGCTPTTNNT